MNHEMLSKKRHSAEYLPGRQSSFFTQRRDTFYFFP